MPPPHVNLGPLARTVLDRAPWRNTNEFPSNQVWADEFERVLAFLHSQGVFEDRFLSRLSANEWEGALTEARAAFFFHRNGFEITDWHPEAVNDRPGDLEVRWRGSEPVFVEVKRPGWEGELSADELRARRQQQPKYIQGDARAVDPIARIAYAVDKALPKFSADRCNLVVTVDDLFMSPTEIVTDWVVGRLEEQLREEKYSVVAGVFMLSPVKYADVDSVEYRKWFVVNATARRPLPDEIREGLIRGNLDPQGPHWSRR